MQQNDLGSKLGALEEKTFENHEDCKQKEILSISELTKDFFSKLFQFVCIGLIPVIPSGLCNVPGNFHFSFNVTWPFFSPSSEHNLPLRPLSES